MKALNSTNHFKHIVTPLCLLVGVLIGLTACGYKGPLYIPTPEQQQKLDAREQRIKARKEAEHQAKQTQKAEAAKSR